MARHLSADSIFRGVTVIDGTGSPRFVADVAVQDDRVLAVGELGEWNAAIEIDGVNRILAPGIIDAHTHDDRALLSQAEMAMKASQGVTTVIAGNCGVSLAPLVAEQVPPPLDLIGGDEPQQWFRFETFGDYLAALDDTPPALNAACLVGHMTLRVGAMDRYDRVAIGREVDVMRERLEEGLDAGAIGFSTGLDYAPNASASTEEIIGVAKALPQYNGIYATHMRNEGVHIIEALNETFEIGLATQSDVVVSHCKCHGTESFGRSPEILDHLEHAMQQQQVGFDVYPYTASSTILKSKEVEIASKVLITWSKPYPKMASKELSQIAEQWGLSLTDAAERLQPAGAIYFSMDEEDVRRFLSHPQSMIGSDGLPHDAAPHPRLWGTFPKVLGHYARDVGLFSLEEAVRKMTSLPAQRFRLKDRGVLRPGAFADLVMFDPDAVIDRATFESPMQPAAGIEQVYVNGRVVWQEGKSTANRPGRALRRN
ncbi:MAG: D-aminoacylase [Gammaproteobacteria bacterium]|nr:D-aminoacylase [Gammaproteobacteria bacterium]